MSNYFATPWTIACQAPLSMGFPRQEYCNGSSFPPPGHLPEPVSCVSCIAGGFFTHWAMGEAQKCENASLKETAKKWIHVMHKIFFKAWYNSKLNGKFFSFFIMVGLIIDTFFTFDKLQWISLKLCNSSIFLLSQGTWNTFMSIWHILKQHFYATLFNALKTIL